MKTLKGILFWAICSSASQAMAAAEVVGLGTAKCSDFIKASETKNNSPAPVYLTWAQGFMSSLNMSRAQRKLPTKSLGDKAEYTPERQLAYLIDYCRKNTSRDFTAATIDMYLHLPTKK